MTITIAVAGRIATVTATTQVVAGNTYPVALSLDSEWTGSLFMRVRFGSLYYDIPFSSSDATVDVQFPVGYPEVGIGIFSEALQVCTSEARIRLLRSILEAGEEVVEFDGDLYDQWEGEVTALLTDDAFDVESTRPVQNAVITAWKGTVALDADVVHKAGAETVAGAKTFTSDPFFVGTNYPVVKLRSNAQYDVVNKKAEIRMLDQKDGTDNVVGSIALAVASGYNHMTMDVAKPDRSGTYSLALRSYPEHMLVTVTPYYPVDGNENPQALLSDTLMASGNIAVDPRIVHTTGNEEIAGVKNFLAPPTCCRASVVLEAGQWCKMLTVKNRTAGNRVLLRTVHMYKTRSLDDKVAWLTQTSSTSLMVRSQDLVFKAGLRSDGYWDLWVNAPLARGPIYIDVLLTQGNVPVVDVGTPQADPPAVGETYTGITDGGVWE